MLRALATVFALGASLSPVLGASLASMAPAAGAVPVAPSSSTASEAELKIATLVPEGSIWDKEIHGLSETVRARTEGRVAFRVYPGGVAGDEPDLMRKLRIGQLHGALLSSSGLGDIDRSVQVFQIPLYFRSDEEARFVLERMDATFRKRIEDQGYVLVHWIHGGWLNFFSTKPVRTVADLKALKQFVWTGDGRLARWYEEAGFRPVPLAATDVLTGFKTGMIECLPSPPLAALAFQWFRSAGHMLDYPVSPLYGGLVLTKRAWSGLSEVDRRALLEAGRDVQASLMKKVPEQEVAAVAAMRVRGLVVSEPEPARGARPWLELSEHFAERMSAGWVAPEVQTEVARHLGEFRGGKETSPSQPPRRSGER